MGCEKNIQVERLSNVFTSIISLSKIATHEKMEMLT